ncbi:hypothetical protein ABZT34_30645 [Streptomyces sp. NPDC005329]|uniref:hypothetical protein n=1 Tax=Streptomyces sp. NPDC005329 TaxID=3157034 RepID=UPI0033BBFE2D
MAVSVVPLSWLEANGRPGFRDDLEMVARWPSTCLVEPETDHIVYASDPADFAGAVSGFRAAV